MSTPQPIYVDRLSMLSHDLNALLWHVAELEAENHELREYRDKYNALLDSSMKHGEAMMGHLLVATLKGNLK